VFLGLCTSWAYWVLLNLTGTPAPGGSTHMLVIAYSSNGLQNAWGRSNKGGAPAQDSRAIGVGLYAGFWI
jgi:hypothetical protein